MSGVFHVGPNGPGKCSAEHGKCPFGGKNGGENHYTSEEAAVNAFETAMEAEAHKTLAKPKKKVEPRNFSDVLTKLYKSGSYGSSTFTPMSHEDLMSIPREQFKDYMDTVEKNDPETVSFALLRKDSELITDELDAARKNKKGLGKKLEGSPEGIALDATIAKLTADRAAIEEKMKPLKAYVDVAAQYILAKTAYEVTQPRVVDGIKLAPGEGLVRGLYSSKGDFLGLVNFNMRAPNQGFSAVAADGTRTPFTQKGSKPGSRYDNLKAQGYVLGQAVVPISLYQGYGGSFHRAKSAAPTTIAANPAKPVPNFDKGPTSWANTVEKQEALIA